MFWPFRKRREAIPNYDVKVRFVETPEARRSIESERLYPGAHRIARSLVEDTGDWAMSEGGYTLEHTPSGYKLWISNGLDFLAERKRTASGAERNIPFSEPERNVIWPAVEKAKAQIDLRDKSEFLDRPPKARCWKSGDVWACRDRKNALPWIGLGKSPGEAYRAWATASQAKCRRKLSASATIIAQIIDN